METHLQMLLEEWRVATDLSFWFSFLSWWLPPCSLVFRVLRPFLGSYKYFPWDISFLCWNVPVGILAGTLSSWKDDSLSAEPPSLMVGLVSVTSEGHLLTLFRPTSGPSWEYCSGKNSMLSSGSDMWQVFRSCCLTSFTYHLYLCSFIKYAINKKYLPFFQVLGHACKNRKQVIKINIRIILIG